jgi:AICAR transformylase/IMP cyclohydrolase PurH
VSEALTAEEKDELLKTSAGVSLSSDAFCPFLAIIDCASDMAQPGGSVQDVEATEACDNYGMTNGLYGCTTISSLTAATFSTYSSSSKMS